MLSFAKYYLKNRKGDLELDELGKMIIATVVLVILIVIVTVYIKGSLDDQAGEVGNVFNVLD